MELTNKELESFLLERIKNGRVTPQETNGVRRNSKKSGVLPNSKILKEDENSRAFSGNEKHRSKASYKWAIEQVEELKPFGNFYKTYFDVKPTREL